MKPVRKRREAVIVDMDGTLQNSDGSHNEHGLAFVREHHAANRAILVVTARDHEYSYHHTREWLDEHLGVPFAGPFCRRISDRRHCTEFKRAVHLRLSAKYEIVAAIDDNPFILGVWRQVGIPTVVQAFDSPVRDERGYIRDW